MLAEPLAPVQLEQLRSFSTCLVASAIETFGVRLHNKGFSDSRLRCIFDDLPPIRSERPLYDLRREAAAAAAGE